jgi:hypothetical protein
LLGNGIINGDVTLEHVTPSKVTNESTAGNGVFYVVRSDSYFMQE